MKIAVIDWNFICHRVWQSLPTRKIPWSRPSEAEEGAHRICEWVYALFQEHQWDRAIIAIDRAPYWRHAAMAEYYASTPVWQKGGRYFTFEGALYFEVMPPAEGENMATLRVLNAAEEKAAYQGEEGETEPVTPPWPIMWPTYKGNRAKQKWECETPREAYNALKDRLAERIARLVKGQVVAVHGAEADDIAAVVAHAATQHEVVLMTGDGDWRYLLLRGPHVSLHNLYSDRREKHSEANAEGLRHKLHCKIIAGDAGDNVPGVARIDRKGRRNTAAAGAEKLLAENGGWVQARGLLVERQLRRNAQLMVLAPGYIPETTWAGIREALAFRKQYSVEPMPWEGLGLLPKERERLEIAGGASRIFAQWAVEPTKAAEAIA